MKQKFFPPTIFVLLAALGIIAYVFLSSSFPVKDKLLSSLYPKSLSSAQESLSISITEPLDGTILLGSSPAYISAITPENVKIRRVEFYVDNSQRCIIVSAPYVCKWQVPAAKGSRFIISAKATDSRGDSAFSQITVTVR